MSWHRQRRKRVWGYATYWLFLVMSWLGRLHPAPPSYTTWALVMMLCTDFVVGLKSSTWLKMGKNVMYQHLDKCLYSGREFFLIPELQMTESALLHRCSPAIMVLLHRLGRQFQLPHFPTSGQTSGMEPEKNLIALWCERLEQVQNSSLRGDEL